MRGAGVLGAVLAGSRALIPDENQMFEPDRHMLVIVSHIHYLPERWRGKFHTSQVRPFSRAK
mgnify:CR=1 FL=1